MDARAFELWGLPVKSEISFEELSARIFPADLDRVREAFQATREVDGAYEIDFRISYGDDLKWVSARGRGDHEGIVNRIMYGIFIDVTFRKVAEETQQTITREMHHRIKNLFSLSSALASIASRSTQTKEAMVEDLSRRLRGLAAAHDLMIPGYQDQQNAAHLDELLNVLLQAYSEETELSQKITVLAPEVVVGERSMTSLAMIVHELATNSAKYGALSAKSGRLVVAYVEQEDHVELVWTESGGPPPNASARHTGFGSELTDRVIKQFGGSIARNWTDTGLIVTIRMNKALLAT